MVTETVILSALSGIIYYNKLPKVKFRKVINKMLDSNSCFFNRDNQQVKLIKVGEDRFTLDIRNVMALEDLYKKEDYISTALCSNIKIEPKGKYVDIILNNKPIEQKGFVPVKTEPYELYVGNNEEGNPIIADMNSFTHMLIGGDSGTGKSVFLMMVLSNLIAQHDNVDLYMLQIRKSDLVLFKDCKQVKYLARDLEQAHAILKRLNDICIERDKKIERHIGKGILNIKNYNNYFKNTPIKYAYILLDEFSFFIPNNTDTTQTKKIKKEILSYIQQIVVSSRSSGIFVVTSLQKPVSSSIPTDIKSQLTTRVAFKLGDNATSLVVLNNGNATALKPRQAIIKTSGEQLATMPIVNYKIIRKAIEDKIEDNKEYISLNPKIEEDKPKANNKGIIKKKIDLGDL